MASPPSFLMMFISLAAFLLHPSRPSNAPPNTLANFGPEQFSFAERRFLLYDVNPGEGFNLRRDVYMRVANAVRQLRERGHDVVLVLPPWRNIWHWRRRNVRIPWAELFDADNLASFVPVIEFADFIENNGESIDVVFYLQHYAEGWSEMDGGFMMKYDIRPCLDGQKYYRRKEAGGKWEGPFFGQPNVRANSFECLSIQGQSSTLVDAIIEMFPSNGRALMVDRAETILHDHFGDVNYWRARKSMRYAEPLRRIGDQFRREKFNQTDGGGSGGGDYYCAHLRRADFVWSHREDIPSIEGAAEQLTKLADSLKLNTLFLCTDANLKEVDNLTRILKDNGIRLERFGIDREDLSEAAISIIDQWICANARWFIGTHQSTFSFRIHEDREILGLEPESTFNRFCPDGQVECEQPAKWRIVHEEGE